MTRLRLGGIGSHMIGSVKFFRPHQGYGFVRREDGGADVFFHVTSITPKGYLPYAGDPIAFEVETDCTGRERASEIKPLRRERLNAEKLFRAADAA
jgi:CspA family cold shock protein